MEFMGLFCANFVHRATALAAFVAISGSAGPQAKSQEVGAARPQAEAQKQQGDAQTLQLQSSQAGPAPQAMASQNGSELQLLTFQIALELAGKNCTQFQAPVTNCELLREDRRQARDALLPSVNYNNSAIYTQSSGDLASVVPGAPSVIFIANNAPYEYVSQGNVHEVLNVAAFAVWRRAAAAAAMARAQLEITARGLVVMVAQHYYKVGAAKLKLDTAKRGADEGHRFFQPAQDLEHGGEVAHADVIKAELQMQGRRQQLQEAQLALLNARLDLAVLIFLNFHQNFEITDDFHAPVPLPTIEDTEHHFRDLGVSAKDAMIQSGRRRLRPIVMKALATIAGMLPLAFAIGAGSQMLQPLAIAVVGGLLSSMVLSLVFTPAINYYLQPKTANEEVQIPIPAQTSSPGLYLR
jgi:AcrB/AcrD/AcrF family/Outer membrane efflux protein